MARYSPAFKHIGQQKRREYMARKRAAQVVEEHAESAPWENDFPAWDLEPLTAEEEQLAWQWYYEQEALALIEDARRSEGKESRR